MRCEILSALALVLVLTGCGEKPTEGTPVTTATGQPGAGDAAEVVARFAGRTLTKAEVLGELERLPAPSRAYATAPDRKRQFVENIILNELLFTEGKAQGLESDPDVERQVADLRKRLVVQRVMRKHQTPPEVSDDEARKYYTEHPQAYSGLQVRASHILVKDEAAAREIAAEVKAHPEKFGELARQKSTDTATASRGGDLGLFGQGRMVPEFEQVAFSLQAGQISDAVKTSYGYHIITVTERKEGTPKPFEAVKEQIKASLRNKATQDAVQGHFEELKRQAGLQIDERVLATITPPPGTAPRPLPAGH